ncbi:hypothetical protein GYMLUDRAFT_247551 [Collybiopsis luxurians FD-317 M1]|uniref:Uncharacterized protein n=1 Tax=Collybiopsis luxurians FD-317 M1 TaxID=944289 RepID=A0A0D0B114_9AGAR|nr:hypothetical protein GYMLUDRAFT_247551 [Collybiopsis luxurians FD-317 M1]
MGITDRLLELGLYPTKDAIDNFIVPPSVPLPDSSPYYPEPSQFLSPSHPPSTTIRSAAMRFVFSFSLLIVFAFYCFKRAPILFRIQEIEETMSKEADTKSEMIYTACLAMEERFERMVKGADSLSSNAMGSLKWITFVNARAIETMSAGSYIEGAQVKELWEEAHRVQHLLTVAENMLEDENVFIGVLVKWSDVLFAEQKMTLKNKVKVNSWVWTVLLL